MTFWESDLAAFFSEFGEAATLSNGTEITVIFDAAFSMASPMGADIESSKPTMMAKTEDVSDLAHGGQIEIRGTVYLIVGIEPDGTGITTIRLSE